MISGGWLRSYRQGGLRNGKPDKVVLIDFGIARFLENEQAMTRTGDVLGTPRYMSPEQANGHRELLPSSNIFSLGCVLFQLLTGQLPFDGETPAELLMKLLIKEAPSLREVRPCLPESLDRLLAHMLAKTPTERPQNGQELLLELATIGNLADCEAPERQAPVGITHESASEQQLLCLVVAAPHAHLEELPTMAVQTSTNQLTTTLSAYGGQVSTLADSSIVVAIQLASMEAASDGALRAVRCALIIKDRLPHMQVVVVTGRAILAQRMPSGEAATRAFSLVSSIFTKNQEVTSRVLLDAVTSCLLEARFNIEPRGDGIFELGFERGTTSGQRKILGKSIECVGRERELAVLQGVFSECQDEGVASVCVIIAPPGIGKTRLLHEFLRRLSTAPSAKEVWLAQGDPLSTGSAYGLLGQVLRNLCGICEGTAPNVMQNKLCERIGRYIPASDLQRISSFLGELCGIHFSEEGYPQLQAARQNPRIMNEQIREAFASFLKSECTQHTILLVLEDLHWADALTIQLIDIALRQLAEFPFMVLTLARPEIDERFPKLWAERKRQDIRLGGLPKRSSERIIHQALGKNIDAKVSERIIALADGNPFYLEELIRAVAAGNTTELPETVLATVQARLMRLEAGARRTLKAASIFVQNFWKGGVQTEDSEEWLQILVNLEFVELQQISRFPIENEYSFRHRLVREAAYLLLTDTERQNGHLSACRFLEQRGESDPLILAEHARQGADLPRAMPYYAQAAEQSFSHHDFAGAVIHAQQSIDCGAQGEVLGMLKTIQMQSSFITGNGALGFGYGIEALPLVAQSSRWGMRLCSWLFGIAGMMGRPDIVQETITRILTIEPQADAASDFLEAAAILENCFCLLAQRGPADPILQRIKTVGARLADNDISARAFMNLGIAWYMRAMVHEPWQAKQAAERSRADFTAIGNIHDAPLAYMVLGLINVDLGDVDAGIEILRRGREVALSAQEVTKVLPLDFYIACASTEKEMTAESLETIASSAKSLMQLQSMPAFASGGRFLHGILLTAEGKLSEAELELRQALEMALFFKPLIVEALATVLLRQGRHAEARETIALGLQMVSAPGSATDREVSLHTTAAEIYHAVGDVKAAEQALRTALELTNLRASRIPDEAGRTRFLQHAFSSVRARRLARAFFPAVPGFSNIPLL